MAHSFEEGWLVSVDDHLIEPPNLWSDRLPAKLRELGPRWISDEKGEAWLFQNKVRVPIGGAVTSGAIWPPEDRPPVFNPLRWDEIPPACYDPQARIEAMNRDHVLAALMFPNLPGFAGNFFQKIDDKELALLCLQAYNDWLLEEWVERFPGRIIGMALIPMWDSKLAAAEAERALARGARAVAFSMAPHNLGFPAIDDPAGYWDPLFSVMNDSGLPLCTHLGTGMDMDPSQADFTKIGDMIKAGGLDLAKLREMASRRGGEGAATSMSETDIAKMRDRAKGATAGREPLGLFGSSSNPRVGGVLLQLAGQTTLVEWLFSGNFERFPNLKVVLSENGIGWIPAVLQVADWMAEMSRDRITHAHDPENEPLLSEGARRLAEVSIETRATKAKEAPLPSEIFRKHMYGCFIHDPVGLRLLDWIGEDNVMIETDFPHNSTWFPFSMEKAQEQLGNLSSEVRHKVLRGNAERVFRFTPASITDPAFA